MFWLGLAIGLAIGGAASYFIWTKKLEIQAKYDELAQKIPH